MYCNSDVQLRKESDNDIETSKFVVKEMLVAIDIID